MELFQFKEPEMTEAMRAREHGYNETRRSWYKLPIAIVILAILLAIFNMSFSPTNVSDEGSLFYEIFIYTFVYHSPGVIPVIFLFGLALMVRMTGPVKQFSDLELEDEFETVLRLEVTVKSYRYLSILAFSGIMLISFLSNLRPEIFYAPRMLTALGLLLVTVHFIFPTLLTSRALPEPVGFIPQTGDA